MAKRRRQKCWNDKNDLQAVFHTPVLDKSLVDPSVYYNYYVYILINAWRDELRVERAYVFILLFYSSLNVGLESTKVSGFK